MAYQQNNLDTFLCPACRRNILKKGKAYYIGHPLVFLICRDCWKGFFSKERSINKFYKGTERWQS